jgi:hypothetical protein
MAAGLSTSMGFGAGSLVRWTILVVAGLLTAGLSD